MKKLLEFSKLIGINAVLELESFENGPAQTIYMPVPKIICINKNLPVDEKISALAHELGHVINKGKYTEIYELADEARGILGQQPNCQVFISYRNTGVDKHFRKSVYELVYLDEVKAWKSAEEILKLLRIKVPKNFQKFKRAALKTYRSQWKDSTNFKEVIELNRDDF